MLVRLLGSLAAHPRVYNAIQFFAGGTAVRRRIQAHSAICAGKTVLDIGGGTGVLRAYLPPVCRYICLDIEPPKLQGFRLAYPSGNALLADASRLPMPSNSVDVVLCVAVSHHLDDRQLDAFLNEAQRVVKKGGRFLFLDALLMPERLPARLLWYLDRGSHPRAQDTLVQAIRDRFTILHKEVFSLYHTYVLVVAERT